jgi:collagen beta-1,O-galactosyltransferase
MEYCLTELGIDAQWVKAVDGATLTPGFLKQSGIHPYTEFRDPHGKRPIKYGEIGCFLSHYWIWQDIVANG